MKSTTTIDSRNFNRATAKMMQITGKKLKDVIKFEASVVFPKMISKTRRADSKRINRRFTVQGTVSQAKSGDIPKQDPLLVPWVKVNGVKERTRAAICDPKKITIVKRELAAQKKIAKARINLSKATFAIWADLHDVSMTVSSTIMKAMENGGNYRRENKVKKRGFGHNYHVTFTSHGRALIYGAGGRAAVLNSIHKPKWSAKSVDEAISAISKACAGTGITVKKRAG